MPLAMERGLAQPPLPQPSRAFVGQQAFAQKPAAVLDHFVFGKILRLRHQHRLDQVGMVQEIHIHPAGAVIKDVAEFARPAGVDRQRIGIEQGKIADKEAGRRAGGTANGRHEG